MNQLQSVQNGFDFECQTQNIFVEENHQNNELNRNYILRVFVIQNLLQFFHYDINGVQLFLKQVQTTMSSRIEAIQI
jgi:hypothetical protein